MSLSNEFLMLAGGTEYYVRRADENGYKIRAASHSDKYAESIGEYPYWDVADIERYISDGSWKIIQNLTSSDLDISSSLDLDGVL